ncbi:hypothetical protein BDK51DRAFT_50499 [Blyttiomyces helicus]|uniref:Uncharacterized protein n=1 Tax=Blyttiomyces helicus TaxID=388810 RepID=A0A4P9VUY1_9FUNG|nr:hypothetical protein BDK51DRAFT_50499 [Blyttiomyces helicus]|eukprot:RKO82922.1 hypothetical protein BDK51DRAFT_50499 [Blyttiomyces helicus]
MPLLSDHQALLEELEKLIISFLDDDDAMDDFLELYLTALPQEPHGAVPRPGPCPRLVMRMAEPEFCKLTRYDSRCPQTTQGWRLAVALCRLGSNGKGASVRKVMHLIEIGAGTAVIFTKRVVQALTDCRGEWVVWPDVARRKEIPRVMSEEGFSGYVGLLDGMTIPLAQKSAVVGKCTSITKKSK